MQPLLFNMGAADDLFGGIIRHLGAEQGTVTRRSFPDGESYLRFETDCAHRQVALVCSLDQPNTKTVPLLLASGVLRDLGAESVGLIAPYLAYMRQDKAFRDGEGVTARLRDRQPPRPTACFRCPDQSESGSARFE
jgi:ribose-phosphate pyrophosphokinase